ncbi:MAG: TetR/AcrR family transcriptional regulator [Candidatus Dormibacteria bacterium]|jgi:AcrR family transcriptional regulator
MRHGTADAEVEGAGGRAAISRRRRAEIVAAAAAVLGRLGSAETSMKEIAAEAGVAPGLLHYYFESKDDLLVAVVGELDRQLAAAWGAAVEGVDDPLERLIAGVGAAADHSARHPEVWRALADLSLLSLSDPALTASCQALRSRFAAAVETEVRGTLGRLPAYTLAPPRDLAGAIAATIEGAAVGALLTGRDATGQFEALKVMILSLVVTAHVTARQEPPIARLAQLLRPR